jgi:hypothetical protein
MNDDRHSSALTRLGRLRFDPVRGRESLAHMGDPAACRDGRQARPRGRIGPQAHSYGRGALERPRPDTGGHISHAIAEYRASEVGS